MVPEEEWTDEGASDEDDPHPSSLAICMGGCAARGACTSVPVCRAKAASRDVRNQMIR